MATIGTVRLVSWCSQISKQRLSLLGCQFSEPYVFKLDSVSLRALGGFFFLLLGMAGNSPKLQSLNSPGELACAGWSLSQGRKVRT